MGNGRGARGPRERATTRTQTPATQARGCGQLNVVKFTLLLLIFAGLNFRDFCDFQKTVKFKTHDKRFL